MKHTDKQKDALVELIRDEQRVRPYPEELTTAQERAEQVRQIKGDMQWLKSHCWITDSGGTFEEDNPELSRVLALLQRELAQAKQGMK